MDSPENQQPINRTESNKTLPLTFKFQRFAIYLLSILILFLAISLGFPKSNFYKTQKLKYTFSSHPPFLQTPLRFLLPTQKPKQSQTPKIPISKPPYCVLWMAPFLSGGGYSSEGWSYILAIHEHTKNPTFRLAIEQHGDMESIEFWDGLSDYVKNLAFELHGTECRMNETIVVCHSEPGAWNPPLFDTLPCPPSAYQNFKSGWENHV